jgi:hypothetical protein
MDAFREWVVEVTHNSVPNLTVSYLYEELSEPNFRMFGLRFSSPLPETRLQCMKERNEAQSEQALASQLTAYTDFPI